LPLKLSIWCQECGDGGKSSANVGKIFLFARTDALKHMEAYPSDTTFTYIKVDEANVDISI
jgi:hypothetical protein